MCGIACIAGDYTDTDKEEFKNMLDAMNYRGPDESSIKATPGCLLGHKRLSIIDVDSGIQPIHNEDKTAWIVCNGEIYNYKKLKKEHLGKHRFTCSSDSEVALHMYEEYGKNCVNYLDGMFAFIISDSKHHSVFAARDPLGIKPLYYAKKDGKIYFTSELKCLYPLGVSINEFPAGHYFTPEDGFAPYRTVKNLVKYKSPYGQDSPEEIKQNIRHLLEKSVQKRLMADVPLGVLLSGGLDSSLIAAITAKYNKTGRPIHSFCIGLPGSADLKAAKEVADYIGTEHHEYIYTEQDVLEAIPRVIYHLESFEPSLVRSAIPTYFVSQLASKYVKVILSGEGADELFAGYAYMEKIKDAKKLGCELTRVLGSLHNINLQRMDRMSMANSLEGRVPFLDEDLVSYVLGLPPKLKLPHKKGTKKIEKWLLRDSFDETGCLPADVLWRKKAEFSEGSGTKDFLDEAFDKCISDQELRIAAERILKEDNIKIRSKQELYFYRIFKTFYPSSSVANIVGHWAVA
jgi:asparagine synthase (glutamine-hydrolysing)